MEFCGTDERIHAEYTMLPYHEESSGPCDIEVNVSVSLARPTHKNWLSSLWMCVKVSLHSTVGCGILIGLFATFLWWVELNVRMYCFADWSMVPEGIHRTQLFVGITETLIYNWWAFSCIAPLCGWPVSKELNLVHYCIIGGLLDDIVRLVMYIYGHYSSIWKSYAGNMIFLMTSFAICYRFARHCKTLNVDYSSLVLALALSLQFVAGLLVSIPFNMWFLDLYYTSSSIDQTVLTSFLIVVFAIPKLFLNHIITSIHGICTPGDEIMLAVAYLTGSTVICRLMQAKIDDLNHFIVISLVHGFLNVADKLSLPLRRRVLSVICSNCMEDKNKQNPSVSALLFLANQTHISIITETTCVVFTSAAAYLLRYYYDRKEVTGERYNGFMLFQEMAIKCSIGVGVEFVVNVISLVILSGLYNVPVISVWRNKWKFIIVVHVVQVVFTVLYFSEYLDNVIVRDYYEKSNSTCFGFFKRE